MKRGYLKHHRKIEDWPLRNNPNHYSVWMRCLELATHRKRKTRVGRNTKPVTLKPGQFISGRYAISKDTGVSPSSVRNILESLIEDNQLDIEKSSQGSVFTVVNWELYQSVDILYHLVAEQGGG